MPAFIFAYGTLQVPWVLTQLLGRCPTLVPGRVVGYRCSAFLDASYPGAVSDIEAFIDGMRVGPLSAAEIACLDGYEGERYERVACWVNGACTYIYVVRAAFRARLANSDWSLTDWLRGRRGDLLEVD